MSITFITKFPGPESLNRQYYKTYLQTNVIINASANNVYYPKHAGGPLSIKYVFKGEEYYINNSAKYRVKNDRFIVFNELQMYESFIESNEDTESFSVFFKPDYTREVLTSLVTPQDKILENPFAIKKQPANIAFVQRLYPKEEKIIPIITKMRDAVKAETYSEDFYNEQLFFLLQELLFLNRGLYTEIEKVEFVRSSTRTEIYRRLNIAKDYISSCYNEKITLETLAEASCMCRHHLLREFKKYYGLTPYTFLIQTRLNIAKQLLSTTAKTITEISSETGFEYLSSFTQAFTKRFGKPPTSFRTIEKVNSE